MSIRFERPEDINALRAMVQGGQLPPDVVDTMAQTGGMVATQPAAPQRRRMRVLGVGGGGVTDLGEEDARAIPLDYTRPGIDIPGVGRGVYTRDGRHAVVNGPDGEQVKVILGYDREGSMRATKQALELDRARSDLEHQAEQTALLRERRKMLAAGPAQTATDAGFQGFGSLQGVPQIVMEKYYGKAPAGKRWTSEGQLEDLPGASQKVTDAQDVLSILEMAAPLIEKSTGSYAGAAIDQGARLFGISTEGAKAAASLKALQGTLVSKMPKMSGPQSDKDVQLYKEMAGQIGDPTIPAELKMAAMDTIRQINEKYAGIQSRPAAASGAPSGGAAPAKAPPPVGTIRNGYVFTGGDPGQQSSWRKVR